MVHRKKMKLITYKSSKDLTSIQLRTNSPKPLLEFKQRKNVSYCLRSQVNIVAKNHQEVTI